MGLSVCWVRGTDGILNRSKLLSSKVMKEVSKYPWRSKASPGKKTTSGICGIL